MSSRLKVNNAIAIGFMTFAFFLGAGNIIFPPLLGQQAGTEILPATIGFLLSGVGLPILALMIAARLDGGLEQFTKDLPPWAGITVGVMLYLSIGPLFAIPRTAVVSYEMSLDLVAGGRNLLPYYAAGFFIISAFMAMNPGRMVDAIGKLVTPALLIVLALMAYAIFVSPQTPMAFPSAEAEAAPFGLGFHEGYMTMDTLAGMVFSLIIIDALKRQGIGSKSLRVRYINVAGIVAGIGLSLVYIMLIYLGASSQFVAAGAENGADILSLYMYSVYGSWGHLILGIVITLACISTAIGLLASCAEYFNQYLPRFTYKQVLLVCTLASMLISNMGLNQLLSVTVHALMVLYPVAITLIFLCLIRNWMNEPRYVFSFATLPVFIYSVLHSMLSVEWAEGGSMSAIANSLNALKTMPFGESGLSWILFAVPGALAGYIYGGWVHDRKTVEEASTVRG